MVKGQGGRWILKATQAIQRFSQQSFSRVVIKTPVRLTSEQGAAHSFL